MTKINEESGEPTHTIYDMGNGRTSYSDFKFVKLEYKQAITNMNRVYNVMS